MGAYHGHFPQQEGTIVLFRALTWISRHGRLHCRDPVVIVIQTSATESKVAVKPGKWRGRAAENLSCGIVTKDISLSFVSPSLFFFLGEFI